MALINTHDLAANVADDYDLNPSEAFGLVEEMLFDLEDDNLGFWAGE